MKLNLGNSWSKVKKIYVIRYITGLVLSNEKRTCVGISRFFGISHDSVYRFLLQQNFLLKLFPDLLICIAKHFDKQKKGWLVFDDTGISKRHSKFIEGVTEYYNSSENRLDHGISLVVLAWSNGDITIPIDYDCWIHKDLALQHYKKKSTLAKNLIRKCIKNGIPFKYVTADGLYFSREMIDFFQENKIYFEMRAHANRSVAINGIKMQLKFHPFMRLVKNQRSKVVSGLWYGHNLFFSTVKRKNKNGEYSIVYQVSNMKKAAQEHVEIYRQRWVIEKFFRTIKQKLGLAHCAARSLNKQKLHIYAVFTAYTFLEIEKTKENKLNPESIVSSLKNIKSEHVMNKISLLIGNFAYVA